MSLFICLDNIMSAASARIVFCSPSENTACLFCRIVMFNRTFMVIEFRETGAFKNEMTTTNAEAVCLLAYYLDFMYAERVYQGLEKLEFCIFISSPPLKLHLAST